MHGLINFIDIKAKCRYLKQLTCKGTLWGRCLSEFIDWRFSQSCWYFRPSFVIWCPSPLLSGSAHPPFPPSLHLHYLSTSLCSIKCSSQFKSRIFFLKKDLPCCFFVKNIYQKYFNEISLLFVFTELFLTLEHATFLEIRQIQKNL
jgi:hypothetical protein